MLLRNDDEERLQQGIDFAFWPHRAFPGDPPVIRTRQRTIYTAGRPPWYDKQGQTIEPFVIGICGGSASGKTTVAKKIIEALNVPWVTLLSMDSFYKVNWKIGIPPTLDDDQT